MIAILLTRRGKATPARATITHVQALDSHALREIILVVHFGILFIDHRAALVVPRTAPGIERTALELVKRLRLTRIDLHMVVAIGLYRTGAPLVRVAAVKSWNKEVIDI